MAVDGLAGLQQAQNKDYQLLAAMVVLVDLAHEARTLQNHHALTMEQYN